MNYTSYKAHELGVVYRNWTSIALTPNRICCEATCGGARGIRTLCLVRPDMLLAIAWSQSKHSSAVGNCMTPLQTPSIAMTWKAFFLKRNRTNQKDQDKWFKAAWREFACFSPLTTNCINIYCQTSFKIVRAGFFKVFFFSLKIDLLPRRQL